MNRLGSIAFVSFCFAIGAVYSGACSSSATSQAKTAETERELCAARAAYKRAAAVAGGALDPVPGSVRARLEAAEDSFCSTHTDGGQ